MKRTTYRLASTAFGAALLAVVMAPAPVYAEEGGEGTKRAEVSRADFDARRKLRTAQSLMEGGEHDRAVAALKNLVEQYPESPIRFQIWLDLGRYYLEEANDIKVALEYLGQVQDVTSLAPEGEQLTGENLEVMLEGVYLTGVSHFNAGDYAKCFPVLRRITAEHPNTVWSNQSYYYIGMAHFLQKNWGKAIKYLSLVGTFVDPTAPTAKYVEAGQRLFIKVEDADLPIIETLGFPLEVQVRAKSGDLVVLPLADLAKKQNLYIATVETEMGKPNPEDTKLQIIGGDTIYVEYVDGNTVDGTANVKRLSEVEVVGTANVSFTNATYEGKIKAGFIGQPAYVVLSDADLDVNDQPQTARIRVASQYLEEDVELAEDGADVLAGEVDFDAGPQWRIRDEVTLTLDEQRTRLYGKYDEESPDAIVEIEKDYYHSGRFAGSVMVVEADENGSAEQGDDKLAALPQDRLIIIYEDELHAGGEFSRVVESTTPVIGRWNTSIQNSGAELEDVVDQTRKEIVESDALFELAKIFESMGLEDGTQNNVTQLLERVDAVIRRGEGIPADLRQRAFRLRWSGLILTGDLEGAIATCKVFNVEYPDSRYADEAMLGIAKALLKAGEFEEARGVLNEVMKITTSEAVAEAQFLLAQSIEEEEGSLEEAIPHYQTLASKFPQSPFAGQALGRLVTYHIQSNDYVAANDMLEQVFEEHPDMPWLDEMLMRWVILAYRMGDYALSLQKAEQLVFEYPNGKFAGKARDLMEKIRQRMERAQSANGG